MENDLFIDGLPIKHGDFPWQTVSHNQRVYFVAHGQTIFSTPRPFADWARP